MFQQIHEQLKLDAGFPFALFRTSQKQQFLHYHDCLELNLVERGEGSYIINGKKYPIKRGDIFVINNKEPHMAVPDETKDDGLELVVLVFDIDLLWRNKGIGQFLTPFLSRKKQFSHRIAADAHDYSRMTEVFANIEKEYEDAEKGWELAAESLLAYLLTLLYRCYDEKKELEAEERDFQKVFTRIRAVFDYIGEHFKEQIKLEELAQLVSLSPHYLCKCFKKVTGRTIFEYIEQMRVQYSCYLLKTTRTSVVEIAMESGFNTVSYYNRVFKKYNGLTPNQYRKIIVESQ